MTMAKSNSVRFSVIPAESAISILTALSEKSLSFHSPLSPQLPCGVEGVSEQPGSSLESYQKYVTTYGHNWNKRRFRV
jgi:hypothetical protein